MITKQTTQPRRTYRNDGVAQLWRKLATGIGLAAGALLIALALLTGRPTPSAAPLGLSLSSDTIVRPAVINPNVPIQHTWSAYDGQAYSAPIIAPAVQGWPGATLTGSAYNGQSAPTVHVTARPVVQGWPGGTLIGSAYNGQ